MAAFPKTLKELCTPAMIYFVISIIALIMVLFQNLEKGINQFQKGGYGEEFQDEKYETKTICGEVINRDKETSSY